MFSNKCKECENLSIQRGNCELQSRKLMEENDRLIE